MMTNRTADGKRVMRGPGEPQPGHVSHLSPERFRVMVSYVLAGGVSVSAAVIALGFVLALAFGWRTSLAGGAPGPANLADFSAMPAGLVALRPSAITQLGLALLLATPVVRVAASVVGFALGEDRLYVVITLVVLAILLGSIFLIR
jgi:uncharacterized membrane protein